jgi:hypothetical protein
MKVRIALQRGGTQLLTVHSRLSRGHDVKELRVAYGATGLGAAADACPRADGY